MDWHKDYQKKICSAQDAVQAIKSGSTVVVPVTSTPTALAMALAARLEELHDIRAVCGTAANDLGFYGAEWQKSFDVKAWFAPRWSPEIVRNMVDERRCDFVVSLASLFYKDLDEGRPEARRPDVVLVEVSPPDDKGMCSFGSGVWNKRQLVREAKLVLAEIHPNLIRTYGTNSVHVSELDMIVDAVPDADELFARLPDLALDPAVKAMARFVVPLIKDRATVQIGGGNASEAIARLGIFNNKHDLGWHSERIPRDGPKLMKEGIFTGKYKTLHPNVAVGTSIAINPEDRDFVNNNPAFELHDVSYVNSIKTIAAHDNFLAINNALAIDLTGQITAESFGPRMYSGTGGLPEFAIGSVLSKGGRSIIVVPSTARGGKASRIVPMLEQGTFITVPRYFTDYIVTEYGVASLLGKTQRERAEQLIAVAHPDFRGELQKEARKMFWP